MDFGTLVLYRRGEQPQPFRLRLGSLSIGSDPSADISIDDGLLERFHARVVCTPAGCQLTDLGSKNGTLVNKERLAAHRPQLLRDGDRIQLGRVGLLYQAPAPAAKAAPPPASESAPSNLESAPSNLESAPSKSESAPSNLESAPSKSESAPSNLESAPSNLESAPSKSESGPAPGEAGPPSGQRGPAAIAPPAPAATRTATPDDWAVLFQVPTVPAGGQRAGLLPGNRRRRPRHDERDLPYEAEDYLALLPPIYHDDRFMRQFLLIFKSILAPLDQQVSLINHYFDPRTAPEHLLPWLAAWVDLVLDERWPEARRRELIGAASVLYRWRGTRRGLSDYLRIYTGVTPRIVEQGQEHRDEPALPPHTFRVIIEAPDMADIDRSLVERIIEQEKPAHAAYQLEIRSA